MNPTPNNSQPPHISRHVWWNFGETLLIERKESKKRGQINLAPVWEKTHVGLRETRPTVRQRKLVYAVGSCHILHAVRLGDGLHCDAALVHIQPFK